MCAGLWQAQRQQAVERFEQEKARSQEQQFQQPLLVIEEVPAVVPCASPKNGLRPGKDPRRQSQVGGTRGWVGVLVCRFSWFVFGV